MERIAFIRYSVGYEVYQNQRKKLTLPAYGFRKEIEAYLEILEDSKVRSLDQLIQFNKDNAETELPLRKSASH